MSDYYHEFTVGFNWWMITMPLFAIAMVALGASLYRMKERNGRLIICKNWSDAVLYIASTLFALIAMIMLVIESGNGIVQYFDNGLGRYESPVGSLIEMAIAIQCVTFLYWGLLIAVGQIGKWARLGYLNERRIKTNKKENPWV